MSHLDHVGAAVPHRQWSHGKSNDHHHHPSPPPPPTSAPFHLLEITIISAQDLHPTFGRTCAYAEAWVDPEYKLQTRVDRAGRTNPNWNDKLVFHIDDNFVQSDTASVTIQIKRTTSWISMRPDPVIGIARLILSTMNPSPETRFAALQVRRPKSLRPQGILNIAVALVDGYVSSVSLCPDIGGMLSLQRKAWEKGGGELEKSGELGRWVVDKEREALQLKLEKWRTELSSAVVDPHLKSTAAAPAADKGGKKNEMSKEPEGKFLGCFSGGEGRDYGR